MMGSKLPVGGSALAAMLALAAAQSEPNYTLG